MKRQILKSGCLFCMMALIMAGCVQKEDAGEKTRKGKNVYDSWRHGMNEAIGDLANIAFLFNTWYTAPEQQKDSIEDIYLPFYKIRPATDGNDEWELYRGSGCVYRIKTNGAPLSQVGAEWEIETWEYGIGYDDYGYDTYDPISFTDAKSIVNIQVTGPMKWDIGITVPRKPSVEFNIVIKSVGDRIPVSLLAADFTMAGKGKLMFAREEYYPDNQDIAYIDFDIMNDLLHLAPTNRYASNDWYWQAGKVQLKAYNDDKQTDIIAAFRESVRNHMRVFITYRGVTEEWQDVVY